MASIKLNIYDENDEVIKTVEATEFSIRFGTIRNLMKLLKIDDAIDTYDLLKTISDAWEELTKILDKCFPDMEKDDWDGVKAEELFPAVIEILKSSFKKIQTIPQSSKN